MLIIQSVNLKRNMIETKKEGRHSKINDESNCLGVFSLLLIDFVQQNYGIIK